MTQSMSVVFIKDTGHVVGASTQLAEAGEPDLELAVGDAFPLHNLRAETSNISALELPLPRAVLDIKSVPYDPAVLAQPQSHVVDGGFVVEIPPSAVPDEPALKPDKITPEIDPAAPDDLKVLTIVVGLTPSNTERRVQSGVIEAGETKVDLNLSVLPGEPAANIAAGSYYGICVAVSGLRLAYFSKAA